MSLAYHDGEFVEKNEITISVTDFGFSRGVAVFEFLRVYGGVPFRMGDHLGRLEHGAKTFGIVCPLKANEISAVVHRLCAENRYAHSGIKFYLTVGKCAQPGSGGFATCDEFTPSFIIIEDEAKTDHPEAPKGLAKYQQGISLKTIPFSRQIPTVKSINYAPGFCATREWAQQGFDEVLYSHHDGYVTETTTANFFAVIDGRLCTLAEGMLYGITRKVLLELAKQAGIPFAERNIAPDELARATESFITGSFVEMIPVRKIDDYVMTSTMDGPVFSKLRQVFTHYIAEHCAVVTKAA